MGVTSSGSANGRRGVFLFLAWGGGGGGGGRKIFGLTVTEGIYRKKENEKNVRPRTE